MDIDANKAVVFVLLMNRLVAGGAPETAFLKSGRTS